MWTLFCFRLPGTPAVIHPTSSHNLRCVAKQRLVLALVPLEPVSDTRDCLDHRYTVLTLVALRWQLSGNGSETVSDASWALQDPKVPDGDAGKIRVPADLLE